MAAVVKGCVAATRESAAGWGQDSARVARWGGRRIAATRIRFPAWLPARRIHCRLLAIHALHGEVAVPKKGCVHPGRLGPRIAGRQPATFHGPGSLDAAPTPRARVLPWRPPTRNNARGGAKRPKGDWVIRRHQSAFGSIPL